MRFTPAILLAAAGIAAAQSSTSAAASTASGSPSGCGHQIDTIIAACLGSTKPQLEACNPNDWSCMCTQVQNVLTCYNNCPSDPNKFGVEQEKTQYCAAASAYSTTSTSSTSGGRTAAAATTTSGSSSSSGGVHTGFATASGSGAASMSSSSSQGAGPTLVPAGGLVAGALLGLAML